MTGLENLSLTPVELVQVRPRVSATAGGDQQVLPLHRAAGPEGLVAQVGELPVEGGARSGRRRGL